MMVNKRILVVDDEEDVRGLLKSKLSSEGYSVSCASSGEECIRAVIEQIPDLVVLDLILPGIDGLDVCKKLKSDRRTQHVPVLVITARGSDTDIVAGLDVGADDYMVKPFSPNVLAARIRAVFRREHVGRRGAQETLAIGGITIDPERHQVLLNGQVTEFTYTEFKILHLLARQPGVVFTRLQLVSSVHGDDYPVTDRSIDVQIVGVRKKLGEHGALLETVRGVGYRFKDVGFSENDMKISAN